MVHAPATTTSRPTTDLTTGRARRPRPLLPVGLAAAATVGSPVIGVAALARASGVTDLGGSSVETEFADPAVLAQVWLLVPLCGVTAALRLRWGVVTVLGVVAPQV